MLDNTGPAAAAAVALMVIWIAEGWAPLITRRRNRTAHGIRNVALGAANGLLCAIIFPPLLLWLSILSREQHIGLLNLAPDLSPFIAVPAALLLLDFWHYLMHIIWHKVPLLWRFHAVHHHDAEVDSTTAFRFHTAEIVMSMLALTLAIPIFGVSVLHILMFKIVLLTTSVFHHANVNIPARLDRALRTVIVTPRMHWVHHSRWEPETDSNYAAIFSCWDRLFRTYRVRDEVQQIELGLDGYRTTDTDTLRGLFLTPLGSVKSEHGPPPGEPPGQAGV